jgi:amidohydrolase family protein
MAEGSPRKQVVILAALWACASPAPQSRSAPPAGQERIVRRTVVILTRTAGANVATYHPDGTVELAYEHLENGRGPKVTGRAKLAADATLASFEAKGTHTLGNPIEERFDLQGGRARWKSREEQGDKVLSAPAFYLPIAPIPELLGMLFDALRRSGGRIALLPDGEARLERAAETTVKTRAGGAKKLVAWAISGLDFTPAWLWTEPGGTFFGVVDSWYSCVAEGWEDAIDPLIAIQKDLDAARDRDLAKKLAHHPPAAGLAFTHARVLDVDAGRWLEDQTVVVVGQRIAALGPARSTAVPQGAQVVDATGKALLPGLWDMHSHLGPSDGVLDLASGVTTARDLGNDPDRLDAYKEGFDSGTMIGPHVLRAGFIEGRGENAAGSKVTAVTEDEAKAAVEFYAKRGYEGIKIYNSVSPELVPVLTAAAHARGMRVSGHIPQGLRAEDAVRAGYDEIQHANMLFLNFFADRNTDTRTTQRFSLVAEKAPDFDLRSRPMLDFIELLQQRKTVVDPTADVFEFLFTSRPGRPPPRAAPVIERLPVQVQRFFRTGGLVVPDGKDEHYKRAFDKLLQMIKVLHDAKVPIVPGTDWVAGGLMLHYELELYARAGIPTADVLRMATLGAARVMKRDKTTGSIAVGKEADLLLVDGDPLARISDTRKVTMTVRSGVLFRSSELYAVLGVRLI